MKLVLAEPRYFKDSMSIISELVSEVKIKVHADALEIVAMDPANVAMIMFKLLSSCFTQYKVSEKEEIAINLSNLKQILRRAKPDDILTLETTDDNKLKLQLKSSASTRSFSIPILELEDKDQRVPELNFPVKVEMDSEVLTDAIEDVSVVAESVTFMGEKNQFSVKAEGDLSKAFIELKPDENTLLKSTSPDTVKAKYSLEYLRKMIAAGKLSDRVSLQFNTDYPLKLEYKIVDRLLLSFILAPRVDND